MKPNDVLMEIVIAGAEKFGYSVIGAFGENFEFILLADDDMFFVKGQIETEIQDLDIKKGVEYA
ncbi:MAG: hypothetical protein QXS54_09520 [Candidatus Methanomethylicaceae archaeon]